MNEIQLEVFGSKKFERKRTPKNERAGVEPPHRPSFLSLSMNKRGRGGEKAMLNLGGSKGRGKDPDPTSCFL